MSATRSATRCATEAAIRAATRSRNGCSPTSSKPFLRQGFSGHPPVFMNFDIGKRPRVSLKPLPPLPPQFEIRGWSEQEYQAAAALITAAYRGHVDSEINDQYRTLTGSLRF